VRITQPFKLAILLTDKQDLLKIQSSIKTQKISVLSFTSNKQNFYYGRLTLTTRYNSFKREEFKVKLLFNRKLYHVATSTVIEHIHNYLFLNVLI
jgi:hypothetical protein